MRYLELLCRWARDFRCRGRGAARTEYLPNFVDTQHLTGRHTTTRHGTVAISWSWSWSYWRLILGVFVPSERCLCLPPRLLVAGIGVRRAGTCQLPHLLRGVPQ